MLNAVKITLVIILCAVCSYAAWTLQGSRKDHQHAEAINAVYDDARQQVKAEHTLVDQYKQLAEQHFTEVLTAIGNIQTQGATREVRIQHEVAQAVPFYSQPLPPAGYALWLSAHRSFVSSSHSSPWVLPAAPTSSKAKIPAPATSLK